MAHRPRDAFPKALSGAFSADEFRDVGRNRLAGQLAHCPLARSVGQRLFEGVALAQITKCHCPAVNLTTRIACPGGTLPPGDRLKIAVSEARPADETVGSAWIGWH